MPKETRPDDDNQSGGRPAERTRREAMRNDARPLGEALREGHDVDRKEPWPAERESSERRDDVTSREREGERQNPTLPADDSTLRTEI